MKLYNNDLEKAKRNAQFLEAKAIQKHVEITSSTLSRFKNNENPEWKNIEAIANIPVPPPLVGLMDRFKDSALTYPQLQDLVVRLNLKHPDWLDYLAIQIETEADLQLVRYIITLCGLSGKTVNNIMSFNPLSIKNQKQPSAPLKVDSFIEAVYDSLFPQDKARKKYNQERSLILENTLSNENQLCLTHPQYSEEEHGIESVSQLLKGESLDNQKAMLTYLMVTNYRSIKKDVTERVEGFLKQNPHWSKNDIPDEVFEHYYETEESLICLDKDVLAPSLIKILLKLGYKDKAGTLELSLFNQAQKESL